jgi:WD40 repeat protein
MQRYFSLSGSRDGRRLVVQEIPEQPRGAFLLDGATGAVLRTCYDQEHGSGPLSVEISPDGKLLAVGYAPYDVILWDADTGGYGKLLEGHSNWVVSLGFSADGTRLISGAGDSTARVWDVSSGKEIGRLRFEGPSTYVWSVGLSPQGDLAFALTEDDQFVVARVPATRK